MKKIVKICISLLILFLVTPVLAESVPASTSRDFRGLWVATVVNIDYPSKPTTDAEALKSEALKILDYAKEIGFNAIFLQVRPTADALYPSKIFPFSKYITGKQGVQPDASFDPLAFWISEAHYRGIELHAWVNPYRVTKKAAGEPQHDFASLASDHPARLHPQWVVKHTDGSLYFDPGIPEVRKLITDGIVEIISRYEVDGIHFDDYFYPDSSFNDKSSYSKYSAFGQSLDDWRRNNVNTLLKEVYKAIKGKNANIRFGVSPFGIWANKTAANPLGSDTKGLESYRSHYADSRYWVKNKLLDYIIPQIYWNIGYSVADYSKLSSWWSSVVSGSGVDLYIGQAAYKSGNTSTTSAWYGTREIENQLELNDKNPGIKGSVFFSYKTISDQPALSYAVKALYDKQDGKTATIPAVLSRPSGNISTSFTSFYLNGSSDPGKPLYLNGKLVENRSSQGYFGVLVPLSPGANNFTLSQEGSYSTAAIFRTTSTSGPQMMSKAEIPAGSAFPQSSEFRMSGEKITLFCQAPMGSKVTVKLGGKTYEMKPSATVSKVSGLYAASYTYVYTIPSYTGTPRNVDLGAPIYTMNYKGTVKTRTAPAKVGVIMKGSPYYAEVTSDIADTYNEPVTGNGAAFELYKGMVDSVTGMTGSYARLSNGQWVFKSNLKFFTLKYTRQSVIKKVQYLTGDKWDTLKLEISLPAAAIASFDGKILKLNVASSLTASKTVLPDNSLFTSVTSEASGNGTLYKLTVKDGQQIHGYYVQKTSNGIELKVKRKLTVQNSNLPLSGITIMLDPGHGGTESGAIGPLGLKYAEKDINLKLALKLKTQLEASGAKVMMTRTADTTVSLSARLTASRNARPDLFVSLHANSMEDNVDISRINGFSVFYREALARPVAEKLYSHTIGTLNRNKHGVNVRNFYVTRGTWTPSILIESGFVPNPTEFEWLTSEADQRILAKIFTESIVSYFSN